MDKPEVIDIHCHTAGLGYGESGCFISGTLQRSWKYKVYLKAFGVTEGELKECGDFIILKHLSQLLEESEQVSKAVILAMDGVIGIDGEIDISRTEIYIPNEFIANNVNKFDNLLYGASINPYRKDSLELLAKAKADGAVLIKWLPSIQNIDPADRVIIPFYKGLQEYGIPLLSHTGDEHSFTKAQNKLADPAKLRLPLEYGVKVIAAHAATTGKNQGENNFDRILPMFRIYKNLYADISGLTQINRVGHMARLLSHLEVHGRLLYGSDMPLLRTGIVSPLYFSPSLSLKQTLSIAGIKNPWDRDVMLKLGLGVPEDVFTRSTSILNVKKESEACHA